MLDILRSINLSTVRSCGDKTECGNQALSKLLKTFFLPDEPSFGSVDKVYAVSCEVLPANFIGVMPQCSDLEHTYIFGEGLSVQVRKQNIKRLRVVKSLIHACCLVFPVCHRALRRYSPGPVVELTSLIDTPAVPKALVGFFSQ